jgi:hypothetical protein
VKYFIVTIDIQNREQEYGEQLVVVESDAKQAFEKAKLWRLDIYCCEAGEKWEVDQLDLLDQVIEIQWPREIPWKDYAVLRKYLPIVE